MKVRVILGTVKYNDTDYKEGEAFELPDKEVASLVAEGVVEIIKDEPKPEPKKEEPKPEPEEPKEEEKETAPEPSEEWTKKELVEHAGTKGVEVDPSMTKKEILEALKGGEESEHKTD